MEFLNMSTIRPHMHEIVKQGEGSQAQTLLDKINDWSKANKFHLNPQKCKELQIS